MHMNSETSWLKKCCVGIVLSTVFGYVVIVDNRNRMLEKSMTEMKVDYKKELQDLKSELESLQSEKKSLNARMEEMTSAVQDERRRHFELSTENYDKLMSKITDFAENHRGHIGKKLEEIEKIISSSEAERKSQERKLQEQFNSLSQSASTLRADMGNMQSQIKDISVIQSKGKLVAFYAYMGSNVDPGIHQPIVFNVIVTNIGGAYNGQNGRFTVPHSGVYVFAWVLFSYEGGFLRSALVINNSVYGHVDTDSGSGRNFISATGVVVVSVNQGDIIYVRTDSKKGGILSSSDKRTQFSGWKLN